MSETVITSIGETKEGEYVLRGQSITTLMQEGDWLGTMILTLFGRRLSKEEKMLFSACLIAVVDHGTAPPSAQVARIVASCGKPIADSVAAGLLTLGPRHGNAASAAARWLRVQVMSHTSPSQMAEEALASGTRLAGFGHAEYARDPRAVTLTDLLRGTGLAHPHLDYALEAGDALTQQKGVPLYLNIDGAIGAVSADLSWPEEMADTIFLIARTVGLCAHAQEEAATSKRYRREKRK